MQCLKDPTQPSTQIMDKRQRNFFQKTSPNTYKNPCRIFVVASATEDNPAFVNELFVGRCVRTLKITLLLMYILLFIKS